MADLQVFTQKDRKDISYAMCLGSQVGVGMAVGGIGLLPGVLGGAATGLAIGLLTCGRLAPAIERKIFSGDEALNEGELLSALTILRDQTGVQANSDAMYIFSQVRAVASAGRENLRGSKASLSPRQAAEKLLADRSASA